MSAPGSLASGALESLWIAQWMKQSAWLYPAIETLHLCGLGLLFGSVVMMDLRILGVGRQIEPGRLAGMGVPLATGGVTLSAATGLLLFVTSADTLIGSTLFLAKISLIFLLLLNAASVRMRADEVSADGAPAGLRCQAAISIAGWIAVIAMGRWLAYV